VVLVVLFWVKKHLPYQYFDVLYVCWRTGTLKLEKLCKRYPPAHQLLRPRNGSIFSRRLGTTANRRLSRIHRPESRFWYGMLFCEQNLGHRGEDYWPLTGTEAEHLASVRWFSFISSSTSSEGLRCGAAHPSGVYSDCSLHWGVGYEQSSGVAVARWLNGSCLSILSTTRLGGSSPLPVRFCGGLCICGFYVSVLWIEHWQGCWCWV